MMAYRGVRRVFLPCEQKDQKSPERNELETALGQLVIAGSGLVATRTDCLRTSARAQGDLDTLVVGAEPGLVVNESGKTVAAIQNREELEHEMEACEDRNQQDKPRRPCAAPRPGTLLPGP